MNNFYSSFLTPKFQELLKQFEEMIEQGKSVYFDSNDLTCLAEYYASQGKPKKAEQAIAYAKQLHPDDLDICIYECNTLLAQGKTDEAIRLLDSLPDQTDYEVRLLRISILLEQGQTDKAQLFIEKLMKEEDESVEALLDISDVYMDAHLYAQAKPFLQKAYQKDSKSIEVLTSMADYCQATGELEKTIEWYKKILDEYPYETYCWVELTKCYLQLEDIEKAFEAVDFALAINENIPEALELKGFCYMRSGDIEKALKYFLKADKLYNNKPRLWIVIAQCYMGLMLFPAAADYLTALLEHPDIPEYEKAYYYEQRALCSLAICDTEACLKDLEAGRICDPQFPRLYLTYGEYYLVQNDLKSAQTEFAHAEALDPNKDEMLGLIASTLLRYEYIDEAARNYARLEKEYPEKIKEYYGYLAFLHYLQDDLQKMTEDIAKGYLQAPRELVAGIMNMGEQNEMFKEVAMNIFNNISSNPDLIRQLDK